MFLNASDFDQNSVSIGVRVQSLKLEEAYNFVFKKSPIVLNQMPAVTTEPVKKTN